MTVEYLSKKEKVDIVKGIVEGNNNEETPKENQIQFSVTQIKDNYYIIAVFTTNNNLECAKALSVIDEEIKKLNDVFIIKDEVSAHYNGLLYPHVNKFERLLRRFLSIKVSFLDEKEHIDINIDSNIDGQKKKEVRETIKILDKMDFGQLHDAFFVDNELINDIRKELNNRPSKTELLHFIQNSPDNSFWGMKVEKDVLKTIRERFRELKDYRNDVMHAHRISNRNYEKALKLYKDVNEELEKATQELIAPNHNKNVLDYYAKIAKSIVNIGSITKLVGFRISDIVLPTHVKQLEKEVFIIRIAVPLSA